MSANNDDESSKVGYKNPPKSTRFKKGESGNPAGRPKGALNVRTIFFAVLHEKVTINEQGQRKIVTKLEAAIKQLVNKAASGDPRSVSAVLTLANDPEWQASSPESFTAVAIGENDQKVMKRMLARFLPKEKPEGGGADGE